MEASPGHLLVVLPGGIRQLTDAEIERFVYASLETEKVSRLRNIAETPLPVPLTKSTAVTRFMPLFVELFRATTGSVDPATLSGITVAAPDSPTLQSLRFTSVTPISRVVYGRHPLASDFYIPLAQFHNFLLQEKRAEFLKLLSWLGASRIELSEEREVRHAFDAKGSLSAPSGDSGGMSGGARRLLALGHSEIATFEGAHGEAFSIPPGLLWMPGEPQWKGMAELRCSSPNRVSSYSINFEYTSDFAVNASLAARVQSIGLECGGSFQDFQQVRGSLAIEFFPTST